MKYVVHKGYSYVDVKGRNRVYMGGEEFEGEIDETQKWKLGKLEQESPMQVATKVIERSGIAEKNATQTQKTKAKAEKVDPLTFGRELND